MVHEYGDNKNQLTDGNCKTFFYLGVFKTLNDLNSSFMKENFHIRTSSYASRNSNNLTHHRPNQVTFGTNSLKSIGPQIWNCLPEELISANSLGRL